MIRTIKRIVLLGVMLGAVMMHGDDVPLDIRERAMRTVDMGNIRWEVMGADSAMDVGFFDIAEGIYERVFNMGLKLREEFRQSVGVKLVRVLINEGKHEEAKGILGRLPVQEGSRYWMLEGVVAHELEKFDEARKALKKVSVGELKAVEQAWYYILEGMVLMHDGKWEKAKPVLEKAKELASNSNVRARVETMLFKANIYSGKDPQGIEKRLKRKMIRKDGTPPPLEIVKQYAVVLDMLGRKKEAEKVLDEAHRSMSFSRLGELDSLLVLKALISGVEEDRGEKALREVLERGQGVEMSNMALNLLIVKKQSIGEKSAFYSFLKDIEGSGRGIHPVMDTMLMMRSKILLETGDMKGAELEALRVLEEFPGSGNKRKVLRLLAEIMRKSDPPMYRKAADYLAQLIQDEISESERMRLMVLVGDCYFLNKDYKNAGDLYEAIMRENHERMEVGPVLYQLVLSKLRDGDMKSAEKLLDDYRHDPLVDPMNLWRGEWNLISQMKREGKVDDAFLRIRELLKDLPDVAITPDLSLRLVWLKAQLSLESGNIAETPELADTLIELLKTYGPNTVDSEQVKLIASHTLLLKGQALLAGEKVSMGLKVMETLRRAYSESKAAIMSYIIEARHYASKGNMARAQQQLIHLSDKYPESEHAAVALYEAALNAEARENLNTYHEALGILERLSTDYPDSGLVYHARMKQGHILRKLGNFGDAELVYKNLTKQYPEHELKYRAEMGRLDCLLAHAGNEERRLKDVARFYERVMETPNVDIDIRAEAGYKSGFARLKANDTKRAKESYWQAITTFLGEESERIAIGEQGRYWLARGIFDLGNLYEKNNVTDKANETYGLILKYGLPGEALAISRMK